MSETEKAPERIWVTVRFDLGKSSEGWWDAHPISNKRADYGEIEYIRADLVQAKDDEIARLTALLKAQDTVSDQLEAQSVTLIVPDNVLALLEKLRASGEGAHMIIADERSEVMRLRSKVPALEADLATARAETAAAFEVAARDCQEWADLECAPSLDLIRNSIRRLTPAHATEALASIVAQAKAQERARIVGILSSLPPAAFFPGCVSNLLDALTPPDDPAAKIGGDA